MTQVEVVVAMVDEIDSEGYSIETRSMRKAANNHRKQMPSR